MALGKVISVISPRDIGFFLLEEGLDQSIGLNSVAIEKNLNN